MRREILQWPNSLLRREAHPVVVFDDETKDALIDLQETFNWTHRCIGLAANQLGINKRIIIVDITKSRSETYIMVNPVITDESEDEQRVTDGCMSVDEGVTRGVTYRPKRIVVGWRTAMVAPRKMKFTGLLAAVIHHEIDHLNGILFTDSIRQTRRGPMVVT